MKNIDFAPDPSIDPMVFGQMFLKIRFYFREKGVEDGVKIARLDCGNKTTAIKHIIKFPGS